MMKQKLEKVGKALKTKAHDKKVKWKFQRACAKVKRAHNRVNALRFKILRTCLRDLDQIGIPVTADEKELMVSMLSLYDKTLHELSEDVKRFRGYVEIGEDCGC